VVNESEDTTDLVLDALLTATWRRKPTNPELSHSDQGSQHVSSAW
jgi:putative transposase